MAAKKKTKKVTPRKSTVRDRLAQPAGTGAVKDQLHRWLRNTKHKGAVEFIKEWLTMLRDGENDWGVRRVIEELEEDFGTFPTCTNDGFIKACKRLFPDLFAEAFPR